MSHVKLTFANGDPEVYDIGSGDVRIEVDAVGGLFSRAFHPEGLIGIAYLTDKQSEAADKKTEAAAKKAEKDAAA